MVYGRRAVYAGPLALPRGVSGSAQRCHWRSGGVHTRYPVVIFLYSYSYAMSDSLSELIILGMLCCRSRGSRDCLLVMVDVVVSVTVVMVVVSLLVAMVLLVDFLAP